MTGTDDAGTAPSGADGVELSLNLGSPAAPAPKAVRRNLTMVYGRSVLCAVDVAELQARAILSMANRKITGQLDQGMAPASPESGSVGPAPPLPGDQAGLSMKRSLQRFLEKRKARLANAASPYVVHHRPAQPPES